MTTKLRYSIAPPMYEEMVNTTLNLTAPSAGKNRFYDNAEHVMTCYVFGVLFFIGLTGNVVSFVVLQNEEFSQKSMRFLLSALAFVDTGLLLFGLLRQWLWEVLSKDPRSFNEVICKIWYFGVYFFGQLSPWTIVLLTLERLLSVCIPVKAKVMFSLKRVVISWSIITGSLFALNCHNIWKVSVRTVYNETVCMHSETWDDFHVYIWLWLDFFLVCGIPFVLIASFNIATIVRLARMKSRRDSLLAGKLTRKQNHIKSTTVMLIVVSAFFLLTTSPLELFFLVSDLKNNSYNDFMYAICNFFYYLNSAANFGLYCLSGEVFRKALAATFVPNRRRSSTCNGYTLHRGSWIYTGNRRSSSAGGGSFSMKLGGRRFSTTVESSNNSPNVHLERLALTACSVAESSFVECTVEDSPTASPTTESRHLLNTET